MIAGQESIAVDESPPPRGRCAWCGESATRDLEVKPASYTTDHHGNRVPKSLARVVPVCEFHFNSLERAGDRA